MFFRREKPHVNSFSDHLAMLREAGFQVQTPAAGKAVALRKGCAAVLEDLGEGQTRLGRLGRLVDSEIGELVDLGYQKVWQTPSGKRTPATAGHLETLHAFEEDLREALELKSLYNESLGTVNASHMYDRVEDRDEGVPKRPWDGYGR